MRRANNRIAEDDSPIPEYYALTAPSELSAERLIGEQRADVVIVGGGVLGLSTALHLAERGVRPVVLEGKEPGWGASGRAFGQLVPYFKHDSDHVLKHYGTEPGERLLQATGRGPDLVFSIIEKHRIQCSAMRNGLIFAAHSPAARTGLERRTRYWEERGAPVRMLGAQETEALIGTPYYSASSLDLRGGTINPLAYTRGLACAAVDSGAVIYTQSPALALKRVGSAWEISTPSGKIVAENVVLAGNAHTGGHMWPGIANSIVPMRAYQLISRPLSSQLLRRILPNGQPMTDTRHLFSGLRIHPDGRLHASADGPAFDTRGEADVHKLDRRIERLFPDAAPIDWEYRWTGWVGMTYDLYPHLHELAAGLYAGFACSGRGLVHATMMGLDLAIRIANTQGDDSVFPVVPLKPSPLAPVSRFLVGGLLTLYRAEDGLNDFRHHSKSSVGH